MDPCPLHILSHEISGQKSTGDGPGHRATAQGTGQKSTEGTGQKSTGDGPGCWATKNCLVVISVPAEAEFKDEQDGTLFRKLAPEGGLGMSQSLRVLLRALNAPSIGCSFVPLLFNTISGPNMHK
eukprot:1150771-Pelagomonas_calceolata.AAC.1